jgi:hypothetical protein
MHQAGVLWWGLCEAERGWTPDFKISGKFYIFRRLYYSRRDNQFNTARSLSFSGFILFRLFCGEIFRWVLVIYSYMSRALGARLACLFAGWSACSRVGQRWIGTRLNDVNIGSVYLYLWFSARNSVDIRIVGVGVQWEFLVVLRRQMDNIARYL